MDQSIMRILLRLSCLLIVGALCGCTGMSQSFLCAPGGNRRDTDIDNYIYAPTTAGTGYPHC